MQTSAKARASPASASLIKMSFMAPMIADVGQRVFSGLELYSLVSLVQIRFISTSTFKAMGGCTVSRFSTLFGG